MCNLFSKLIVTYGEQFLDPVSRVPKSNVIFPSPILPRINYPIVDPTYLP